MLNSSISKHRTESRSKTLRALGTFCIFTFMFDSGGELGLRNLGFILALSCVALRFRHVRFDYVELRVWVACICLLMPSIMISSLLGVEAAKILTWVSIFFIFPLFLQFARAARIDESDFIKAGLIFSMIVIIIFFGRVFQIAPIVDVHLFISERTAGFFNEKAAYSEEAMPVVYFQGTLTLVICGVLAVAGNRWWIFIIITLALAAAPSRVGTLACVAAGLYVFCRDQSLLRGRNFLSLFFLVVCSGIIYVGITLAMSNIQVVADTTPSTRHLHFDSILLLFAEHPVFFFFGNGPGSEFYSSGVGEMTNNIEISQLEILRKFGVIFAGSVFIVYGWIVWRLIAAGQRALSLAMIAHFFVAASNPVLFSIPAVVMFATSITRLHELKISPPCQLTDHRV